MRMKHERNRERKINIKENKWGEKKRIEYES